MIEVAERTSMKDLARRARDAAVALRGATAEQKTRAIGAMARGLRAQQARILEANARDVTAANSAGMGSAKVDRLTLSPKRLEEMAQGLESVAALPDPVGKAFGESVIPSGLRVQRMR